MLIYKHWDYIFLDLHYEQIYTWETYPFYIQNHWSYHNHETKNLASYMLGNNLEKGDVFLLCKFAIQDLWRFVK